MKLASFFSGGKDSTYAIYKARNDGHEVVCLVSIFPHSEESHLLHYPNIASTQLQARAMGIPQITGRPDAADQESEERVLVELLKKAINDFGIEGILHGGLFSEYQKKKFEKIAGGLGLKVVSPLWHVDQKQYLLELLEHKFKFILTSVTSGGLDKSWLGREITCRDVDELERLAARHGFNLAFEGGEAETFVTDCPLFCAPVRILRAEKIWDGYRGRFEITDAVLEKQC